MREVRDDLDMSESGVPFLEGCREPRPRPARPVVPGLLPAPAAPIIRSPSLSSLAGAAFSFCIPPLFGIRLEARRPDVLEARGPVGAVGAW